MARKATNKKRRTTKKLATLQERAMAFHDDEVKLLKKYKLAKNIVVLFPQHRKPPFLGRLAIKMLKWSRAHVDAQFIHNETK